MIATTYTTDENAYTTIALIFIIAAIANAVRYH
ncbi:hypothetical protein YPC_1415 [Yersinia pestis biovar Medievalis str. Harbin 35]|nr:hypothetical protein YPC_1415 [Yersinia pestis biovar Medievalis str. Harbin 35]EEO76830.1 hypothetical protein YP516_1557 [Yersinia pestis Nepal516]EEO79609.1 hypothetical protein YPF_3588 [Yersinia pestis biovar Orientalis str. India 195]EEO84981.1 hypothetical protein YPH_0810 [Yersinia pestis biovar Orientalis str. PEXU2]EEO89469.1 hypothetical protein YPS_3427 [Yersinia pestis Pestoides A]